MDAVVEAQETDGRVEDRGLFEGELLVVLGERDVFVSHQPPGRLVAHQLGRPAGYVLVGLEARDRGLREERHDLPDVARSRRALIEPGVVESVVALLAEGGDGALQPHGDHVPHPLADHVAIEEPSLLEPPELSEVVVGRLRREEHVHEPALVIDDHDVAPTAR